MTLARLMTIAGLVIALTSACSTTPVEETDPAQLFKQAEEEIKDDHFILATEHLKNIRNKFPYSQFAPLAQLKLGDVYFLQESFAEAASAYETFRDLYPKHEKAPYALFRAAKSHYRDCPTQTGRDLSPAVRAVGLYDEFLRRYPSDSLKEEAASDLVSVQDLLARKEFEIASFYSKQGKTSPARARLEALLLQYPRTPTAKAAQKTLEEMAQP